MRLNKRYLVSGIGVLALLASVASVSLVWWGGGGATAKSSSVAHSAGLSPANVENAAATGAGVQLVSNAPATAAGKDPYVFQYSGEFLCGQIPQVPGGTPFYLGPGFYNTEISIHNPNNDPVVYLQKKVVPLPPPEQEGQPTPRRYEALHPDGAKQIDCTDIQTFFPAGQICALNPQLPNFCKGYVVVEGAKQIQNPFGVILIPAQLDVTVTITVTSPATNDVQTMEVTTPFPKIVSYPCWSAVPPVCP
jgi:hypothetical protein